MKEQTKATEVQDLNEEEIVDDVKKERFSRTKTFFAKHKKAIGLAAAGVATTVASALILKNKLENQYNAGYEDGLDHQIENITVFDLANKEPETDEEESATEETAEEN